MAVNGALTELTFERNWEQFGTVTPEEAAEAMTIMLADYFKSEAPVIKGDSMALLFGSMAVVKVGGAMIYAQLNTNRFGGYFQQNPAANGDRFAWTCWLDAADYQYRLTWQRNGTSAIARLRVSDAGGLVENVNVDMFGGAAENQITTGAFTLTVGKETEISIDANGKNAGSAGYLIRINSLEIWRV